MSKNLQSPTKLTEFAPLQQDEKPQSVTQILSKFFKINKNYENAASSDSNSQEALPTWAIDSSSDSSFTGNESSPGGYSVDVNEGRSLPNVLRRISNLVALKSNNLQDYADTELKQYWMPDSVSRECYECSEKFTTFRRRHHCRVCGQIFCSQCCNQQIPGKIFGCTGDLRVCTYCCKVVLSYLQSSDLGADLSTDLKTLQENLLSKFGDIAANASIQNVPQNLNLNVPESHAQRRKISVGYQEEKFASGSSSSYLTAEEKCKALQNSISLRNLYEEICKPITGITLETHRYRLRTYNECFLGSELVDWLICQQKAKTRVQAAAICQALLEADYIECLVEPCSFIDGYILYKKGSVLSPNVPQAELNFDLPLHEEPIWVQSIPHESSYTDSDNETLSPVNPLHGGLTSSSSYMLDLNIEANTVYLSRPNEPVSNMQSPEGGCEVPEHQDSTVVRPSEQREAVPESGWYNASKLREENGEKEAYMLLTEAYEQHQQSFLKQLLSSNCLSLNWVDVILPLIRDVVTMIRPDKNHDAVELDIRHYVKLKKLTGGLKSDSALIGGIVCSKNVAHKDMLVDKENPKILLLDCSIVYQRTEGRLMSIEPVLMQEHEYLRHVAARIVALQPDVVLVQRNVSRLAQDMLRQHKLTLVHNVKQSVLERLARCTDADLVTAVDAHIGRPKLGTCKRFYLKSFNIDKGGVKTLMFFEGLPQPHLGGTVLLRGASKFELTRLKKVVSLLIFTAYNWRLEKSLLMDEFALPPNSKMEFLDDSKENSPTKLNDVSFEIKRDVSGIKKEVKIDANKKVTVVKSIDDFTDPLHSAAPYDDKSTKEGNLQKFTVAELPFSNNFRKYLDDTILCISPYIVFAVPYLETDLGKKCKLRHFFPEEVYFSEQFNGSSRSKWKEYSNFDGRDANFGNDKLPILHPFLTAKITNIDNNNIQNMLANFRACGGRYPKKEIICTVQSNSPIKEDKTGQQQKELRKDVLDPNNHQRLAVLFCSFSHESPNAPAFCVNPWVVYMDFYGRNDIPLGCFLERYCFRPSYFCPSKSCDTPMIKHIRRFVHNSGCVSISLNNFENEFSEEGIVMWTWCTQCQSVSPVVHMSSDTWSYSFAKYLELKFHGDIFSRRGQFPCTHSLHHDHFQYFGYKNYVASFKYTSINIWEISLPPPLIDIEYDIETYRISMIDETRILSQKGHEIFSIIYDKIALVPTEELEGLGNLKQLLIKEQNGFKQKVEEIQLKLTSPTVKNKEFVPKDLAPAYWKIFDNLTKIKSCIIDTVDSWNIRLSEAARKKDKDKDNEKSKKDNTSKASVSTLTTEPESPIIEAQEILAQGPPSFSTTTQSLAQDEKETGGVLSKIKSLDEGENTTVSASPKSHQRSQSDGTAITQQNDDQIDGKKDANSDKKTVKNIILDKLLPSSAALTSIPPPFNTQEHCTLPIGVYLPVIVFENEPSSIVAYALNSYDYKKSLEEIMSRKPAQNEQTPSPVNKRKSLNEKEKIDDEKTSGILGFLRNKESTSSPGTLLASETISEQTTPEKLLDDTKKSRNSHVEVQFQDATCNFFCRIYLAEKFAALRSEVLPIGEEGYIRSMSRSVQWKARGGKSGSTFAKTLDDRFILKDMSKSEVQLFLESASNYFSYMHKCYITKQPTLLGKIVGIYQIIFKNNFNVTLRTHLLVMENLFYNREVTQKFDLKGSMRNRMVVPDNQEGEIVLLDENLLKMTCDSPLYILPHSKAVLTAAIQNDTEFLSAQSVMDYSLLVGLDPKNKELVLGIIERKIGVEGQTSWGFNQKTELSATIRSLCQDYIRTFTWDKRLETMVKKSGILGGQGKLPTIVSPEEYQKRFIEAMHKYFLEVPDHWAGLGKGVEF